MQGPVVAMVWEGDDVIATAKVIVGHQIPAEAALGTIRGDFGLAINRNVLTTSETDFDADRDINLFFKRDELNLFKKADEAEVYEIVAPLASPKKTSKSDRKRKQSGDVSKDGSTTPLHDSMTKSTSNAAQSAKDDKSKVVPEKIEQTAETAKEEPNNRFVLYGVAAAVLLSGVMLAIKLKNR